MAGEYYAYEQAKKKLNQLINDLKEIMAAVDNGTIEFQGISIPIDFRKKLDLTKKMEEVKEAIEKAISAYNEAFANLSVAIQEMYDLRNIAAQNTHSYLFSRSVQQRHREHKRRERALSEKDKTTWDRVKIVFSGLGKKKSDYDDFVSRIEEFNSELAAMGITWRVSFDPEKKIAVIESTSKNSSKKDTVMSYSIIEILEDFGDMEADACDSFLKRFIPDGKTILSNRSIDRKDLRSKLLEILRDIPVQQEAYRDIQEDEKFLLNARSNKAIKALIEDLEWFEVNSVNFADEDITKVDGNIRENNDKKREAKTATDATILAGDGNIVGLINALSIALYSIDVEKRESHIKYLLESDIIVEEIKSILEKRKSEIKGLRKRKIVSQIDAQIDSLTSGKSEAKREVWDTLEAHDFTRIMCVLQGMARNAIEANVNSPEILANIKQQQDILEKLADDLGMDKGEPTRAITGTTLEAVTPAIEGTDWRKIPALKGPKSELYKETR